MGEVSVIGRGGLDGLASHGSTLLAKEHGSKKIRSLAEIQSGLAPRHGLGGHDR